MKRRKFIKATGLLPFLSSTVFVQANSAVTPEKRLHKAVEDGTRDFFYKPVGAWAADFIPFYDNGEFHLFYLLDWRDTDKHGEGTPWYRISTKDFVHFTEHGEMLPRGTAEEQDLYVFTGSVIKANGQYHIFYTGHNGKMREKGKPEQGIMHAVSNDMVKWTKIPEHTFFAPADKYEPHDWRDPFVFWNEEANEFNMLLAARFKKGIPRRRGLTGLCASKDLIKWEVKEPFYTPGLYYTHECPDLFKMGDWWYLVFSEFTDLTRTRYRMSRSMHGPWLAPERDSFDGHAFYAAKTATDGKDRYIFGWNPTRSESKDNGGWEWGGNLVVHKIVQQKNGELAVRVPDTVTKAFSNKLEHSFATGAGNYSTHNGEVTIKAPGSFAAASGGKMPATCKISASISFEKNTRECGILLRCSEDFNDTYYIRLEPRKNRLVFDMWPRDQMTHQAELDREIILTPGVPVEMQVFIDGNKGVVYVNNIIAMNFRAYNLKEGNWGLFTTDGNAVFKNLSIAML
ncbi:family 43 glycosylhydrolase [Flavihumibacter profundi]|jgi:beta-fructofuranosidase|uniref:family 43 glycosylhydrolase n=1 Tax=Flavihumibacter profundi TaxID=2716883 RepID=UPI001CC782A7|nr:family 43 glycosylhydrolase [Flavihumibacter profundi]MBZ5855544.1 family 43 glycosylhydrolase [Flavihumibacter profundi]